MLKFTIALCLALLTASPSPAGIFGVTADGTWDCADKSGTYLGAIVVADETYAFIKPDGLFGTYGRMMKLTENTHLPHFAVINGYLKDVLAVPALALQGPPEDIHDMTGELFLSMVLPNGAEYQCVRRVRTNT
jgi:hypothetical protein